MKHLKTYEEVSSLYKQGLGYIPMSKSAEISNIIDDVLTHIKDDGYRYEFGFEDIEKHDISKELLGCQLKIKISKFYYQLPTDTKEVLPHIKELISQLKGIDIVLDKIGYTESDVNSIRIQWCGTWVGSIPNKVASIRLIFV